MRKECLGAEGINRLSLTGNGLKVLAAVTMTVDHVGMRFLPHKDVAIKMSYAYMSQYVHMLSNSSVSLPTDLWVPITANIPPMRSMQAAVVWRVL